MLMVQEDDLPNTARSDGDAPAVTESMRVVVLTGPDRGLERPLTKHTFVIGKSRVCDLALSDAEVSREHLELTVRDDGIFVRDLGSTNGSFFHGARFSQVTIGVGGRIRVGTTELQIAHDDGAQALLPSEAEHFGGMWGRSISMRQVFSLLERVAQTDATVLVNGETGTGKEVCAHALHQAGPRSRRPFVVCDISAIPRSLIESELFGHVRGAFTGADRERVGAFAQADGGTLFLDEIGELDLDLQPRLLRAIEQQQIKPVGSNSYQQVDIRVVSATNRDLREEVAAGRFRQDLFFRLSTVEAKLPPLRERVEDIPLLVENFLAGRGLIASPQALAILSGYGWPGNVRELRNVLERAIAMSGDAKTLTAQMVGLDETLAVNVAGDDEKFLVGKERLISRWEKVYLTRLLERTNGNISAAAREGGIARVYLYRLLKKHGMRGTD